MESNDFYDFMKEIVSNKFFTDICSFTKEEKKQKEDWIVLTKGMLLLDVYCNLKWKSEDISDGGLIGYLEWARKNYDDLQKNTLRSVMEYLEEVFSEINKPPDKEIVPWLICQGGRAMYDNMEPNRFVKCCIVKI